MFPRWLSWMFLLTMGYIIFSASQGGKPVVQATAPIVPAITKENYPALAEVTDIERWKRKLNPDYAAKTNCSLDGLAPDNGLAVKVIIEEAGDGAGAKCGQAIFLELTIWNDKAGKAYTGAFPVVLGARTLAAGLDFALLDIRKGEARSVIIPPYALVRAKTSDAPIAAQKALGSQRIAYLRVKRLD